MSCCLQKILAVTFKTEVFTPKGKCSGPVRYPLGRAGARAAFRPADAVGRVQVGC